MIKIELTEAEHDFLMDVVEAGFKAMGISTLFEKLQAARPAAEEKPAAE